MIIAIQKWIRNTNTKTKSNTKTGKKKGTKTKTNERWRAASSFHPSCNSFPDQYKIWIQRKMWEGGSRRPHFSIVRLTIHLRTWAPGHILEVNFFIEQASEKWPWLIQSQVTYSVNADGGYIAEVSYEGTAVFPEVTQLFHTFWLNFRRDFVLKWCFVVCVQNILTSIYSEQILNFPLHQLQLKIFQNIQKNKIFKILKSFLTPTAHDQVKPYVPPAAATA